MISASDHGVECLPVAGIRQSASFSTAPTMPLVYLFRVPLHFSQEAVHLLLGDHVVSCSRTFANLNGDVGARHMLGEHNDGDDDDLQGPVML
jgi:hypothetical protein